MISKESESIISIIIILASIILGFKDLLNLLIEVFNK